MISQKSGVESLSYSILSVSVKVKGDHYIYGQSCVVIIYVAWFRDVCEFYHQVYRITLSYQANQYKEKNHTFKFQNWLKLSTSIQTYCVLNPFCETGTRLLVLNKNETNSYLITTSCSTGLRFITCWYLWMNKLFEIVIHLTPHLPSLTGLVTGAPGAIVDLGSKQTN